MLAMLNCKRRAITNNYFGLASRWANPLNAVLGKAKIDAMPPSRRGTIGNNVVTSIIILGWVGQGGSVNYAITENRSRCVTGNHLIDNCLQLTSVAPF